MKTLDEHNDFMSQAYINLRKYPKKNGIACNVCGSELFDTNGNILTSNPPKLNVHCETCGFEGYRVAP